MTPDAAKVTEVAVKGWSWTATLVAVFNLIVGGAFVAWIKSRARMRELEKQSEEELRGELIARVTRLEERLEFLRVQYESRLEHERVSHAADLALVGKRINNLDQCLTMILALIEANSAKANKAAGRVREMRKAQAGERGTVSTKEA